MDKGGAPAGDHDAANKVARARDCRGVHAGEVGRDEKDDAQEAGEGGACALCEDASRLF